MALDWILSVFTLAGTVMLNARIWVHGVEPEPVVSPELSSAKVSIIVPVHDSSVGLETVLPSLLALDYLNIEILVVEERGSPEEGVGSMTLRIDEATGVKYLRAGQPPPDWLPKTWACHQGARFALGNYFLFTTADTIHGPDSLSRAMAFLRHHKLDLVTAMSFRLPARPWERLLGPFYALALATMAPFGEPRRRRLFAEDQYLLFDQAFYWRIGGHSHFRSSREEGFAFANLCLETGHRFLVYRDQPLIAILRPVTLRAFVATWRRRFGNTVFYSRFSGLPESALMALALLSPFFVPWSGRWWDLPAGWGAWIAVARFQKQAGEFSILGLLSLPFSVGLFIWVSILAGRDSLFWQLRRFLFRKRSREAL